jgi:biotin carboxyl carrier protein
MKLGLMVMACMGVAVYGFAADSSAPVPTVRGVLEQGGFWVGQAAPGSTAKLNGEPLWVRKDGLVVVGFPRDAGIEQKLEVCAPDADCQTQTLNVKIRKFVTQNVTKVPPKTVEPSPAELKQMEADNAATQAARDIAMKSRSWEEFALLKGATLPIDVPTSGVFGSRRTYNGQERSWHKGHDLAAKTGTPVKAPADGTVRLARLTFMSGNLIMLDHGAGVTTVYAHLSHMDVKPGDKVKRGQVIGKVGTTGRSSGPHLHWGLYWQNVAIDPMLWVVKQGETAK